MKKIWIINHYAEVPPYGKYTRHFTFAKKLVQRGHSVEIFTASTVHNTNINYIENNQKVLDKIIEGIPVHFIKARSYLGNTLGRIGNILDYFMGVMEVTKSYGAPDIVYCSSPHPLNWIAAYRVAKRHHAQLIAETRDLWPETFVSMGKIGKYHPVALVLYAIEKFIYKRADTLIFTLQGGRDYLKERKIDREEVYYINNGIEVEEYQNNQLNHEYMDLDLDSDEYFKVIYTGALGQANQVKTILEAAKIVKDDCPKMMFIIFGDGYQENELKSYAQENNLTNVRFKGKVEKKYIPSILSKSNLNIITGKALSIYRYGVSLNKIPEYLAAKKPILSNMKVGYDIITETEAGIVVSPENSSDLAKGLREFYNMDSLCYNEISTNASKALKMYDFEYLTDLLEGSFK